MESPLGRKSANTNEKTCSEKHFEKHCTQSASQEVSQEPLQSSKHQFRVQETIVFIFTTVPPKDLTFFPLGTSLGPFRVQNVKNVSQRPINKNFQKSIQILMPPGAQMDTKMVSNRG